MKRILFYVLLLQIIWLPSHAAEYMTSARGGGMGFSYFLLADDPSGAVYNPAGVGFVKGWQSYMMFDFQNDYEYVIQNEDPYNGRFAIAYPLRNLGAISINTQQTGSLEEITGVPTVNHGAVTFAREFFHGWSAGASFKYLYETMYAQRSAYDFDLGVIYKSPTGFIGAVAFENILRSRLSPDYLGTQEYLPRRERFGLGYVRKAEDWRAAFTAAAQIEESGISYKYGTYLINFGSEWWFMPENQVSFGARGGFTFGQGIRWDIEDDYGGFSAGFSLNIKVGVNDLRFDYGMISYPYEIAGDYSLYDHSLAASFGWGGIPDYSFKKDGGKYEDDPVPYRPGLSKKPQVYKLGDKDSSIDKDTDFKSKSFVKYDIIMDVADISAVDFKRIVFYLRPQSIVMTNEWKLYVFRAKIKNWSEGEIDRWALKVVEGKGVPPLNVVWDGVSLDGNLLPPGKYYYILTATDSNGNRYATKWHKFKLD
ncbi:MAG: hypothetical protein V3W18_01030 [candidate division Zixibacteria bacterium]